MAEGDDSIDSDIRTAVMAPDALPTVDVVREAERKLLESPPSQIGEYAILRTLGSGGMGIVFVGYDERLDRKVAIKLLRASVRDGTEGRARILREAQAMARLSHPNVVQVYDVGEHEGTVYVAMEFVAGETLREWSERPRPWREVVAVLVGAGRGLAAAHAEGLVHRDFKPENVLVGRDGRPRVLDFGLARAANSEIDVPRRDAVDLRPGSQDTLGTEITRDGAVVGTPAYMSPQQHVGDPPDPRSDQFSFCVTAFETLYGKRPFRAGSRQELTGAMVNGAIAPTPSNTDVPAWVHRTVLRGLAAEPEDRWPSMDRLLDALEDDPGLGRRRTLKIGALTFAALAAGALLTRDLSSSAEVCTGAATRLTGVWDEPTRTGVARAFEALPVSYAGEVWTRAEAVLDRYATEWIDMHTTACEAHQRGEESARLFDRRMRCLDRRLEGLGAMVSVLASADSQTAERAVQAVTGLEPLSACEDLDRLEALAKAPPPELAADVAEIEAELARQQALSRAGRFEQALALATELDTRASALEYRPLRAETRYALGRALQQQGDAAAAEPALEASLADALATESDALAAACASQLVYLVGEGLGRYPDAMRWSALARALIDRGAGDELEGARLSMLTGNVLRAQGDFEAALAHQQRAVEQFERVLGPDHLDVGVARNNLGGVQWRLGDLAGARRNLEAGLRIREKALGPRHPQVASSLNNLAIVLSSEGRHADALAMHEQALELKRELLGEAHPSIAYSLHNLGDTLHRMGRLDEALARLEAALAMREKLLGKEHPSVLDTLSSLGTVLVDLGRPEDAVAPLERAIDLATGKLEDRHPDFADPLTALGRAELALGHGARSRELLERALAIRTAHDSDPGPRGDTRLALALALAEDDTDRARALALAEAAREDLREGGPGWETRLARAEDLAASLSADAP